MEYKHSGTYAGHTTLHTQDSQSLRTGVRCDDFGFAEVEQLERPCEEFNTLLYVHSPGSGLDENSNTVCPFPNNTHTTPKLAHSCLTRIFHGEGIRARDTEFSSNIEKMLGMEDLQGETVHGAFVVPSGWSSTFYPH